MTQPKEPGLSPERKMSEMITEMAASFIGGGKTPEEEENRPTALCSASSMANSSPENRRRQLEQYVEGYRPFDPGVFDADRATKDMRNVK